MGALIRDLAASTPEMLAAFDDEALIRAALRFETELAAAGAAEVLLTERAAAQIAEACEASVDIPKIAAAAAHAGTLAIPLVAVLRERVARRDPAVAPAVHLGATSQDLADTVLMLQAKDGCALLARDLDRLMPALARLAETHATTPMLGRTLLQAARPTTFGLTAANWLLGIAGAAGRLRREAQGALLVQLGGAVGTHDALEGKGAAVTARLARALGLGAPPTPWHSRREGVAGLASALAILAGALGKLAVDIALLSQSEVAEVFEPRQAGRGGSSVMAHKRNPTGCQIARSAALRAPHLAATIVAALPQELERGLGGWQAEGPVLAELFAVTHGALAAMTVVVGALEVRPERMAANLAAAGLAEDMGEAPALTAAALEAWRRATPPSNLDDPSGPARALPTALENR
jgi:3-carboxy-cis,cis-muconate cycloisomerase